jgi:hypothetical protein
MSIEACPEIPGSLRRQGYNSSDEDDALSTNERGAERSLEALNQRSKQVNFREGVEE